MIATNGTVQRTYSYDPWGRTTATPSGADPNPFRYIGGVYDSGTGLYKLGARYYDPGVGRFTQLDPMGGQYAYAGDDPINNTDLSGFHFILKNSFHQFADEQGFWGGTQLFLSNCLVQDLLSVAQYASYGFGAAAATGNLAAAKEVLVDAAKAALATIDWALAAAVAAIFALFFAEIAFFNDGCGQRGVYIDRVYAGTPFPRPVCDIQGFSLGF